MFLHERTLMRIRNVYDILLISVHNNKIPKKEKIH